MRLCSAVIIAIQTLLMYETIIPEFEPVEAKDAKVEKIRIGYKQQTHQTLLGCYVSIPNNTNAPCSVTVRRPKDNDTGQHVNLDRSFAGDVFFIVPVRQLGETHICQLTGNGTEIAASETIKNANHETIKIYVTNRVETVRVNEAVTWRVDVSSNTQHPYDRGLKFFLMHKNMTVKEHLKSNLYIIGTVDKFRVVKLNVKKEEEGEYDLVACNEHVFATASVNLQLLPEVSVKIIDLAPLNMHRGGRMMRATAEIDSFPTEHYREVRSLVGWYFIPCTEPEDENCVNSSYPHQYYHRLKNEVFNIDYHSARFTTTVKFHPYVSGYLKLVANNSSGDNVASDGRELCVSDAGSHLQGKRIMVGQKVQMTCQISTCNYDQLAGIVWFVIENRTHYRPMTAGKQVLGSRSILSELSTFKTNAMYRCKAIKKPECKKCPIRIDFPMETNRGNNALVSVQILQFISIIFFPINSMHKYMYAVK